MATKKLRLTWEIDIPALVTDTFDGKHTHITETDTVAEAHPIVKRAVDAICQREGVDRDGVDIRIDRWYNIPQGN